MNCELCGRETQPFTVEIEGTEMQVCEKCSTHGKILKKPAAPVQKKTKHAAAALPRTEMPAKKEIVEAVVDDYAKKIRGAREKKGLTQKEFAKLINEKESILQKMETGKFEPPITVAKKLEKMLHIQLIEQREEEKEEAPKKGKSEGLTIGDIIKL